MLTDAKIKAAKPRPDKKPYKLSDAEQLYLYVSAAGGRHWRMNYTWRSKQKTLAFGSYPAVTLSDARRRRDEAKALLRDGKDPALEKRLARAAAYAAEDNTFEKTARAWYEVNSPRWSTRHAADVLRSLERDVFPEIGELPISAIGPRLLVEVLGQIAKRGAIETAHRIQQRIDEIFVYALLLQLVDANPAAGLGKALPKKPRAKRQPSVIDGARTNEERITRVRQLLIDGEAQPAHIVTKLALRLLAMTAVRPNELRGARWTELEDLDGAAPLWRIPAARMKGDDERKAEEGGDHLVPLPRQALELLEVLRTLTGRTPMLFPNSRRSHQPLSENALGYLLNRAGYHHKHVPHGFRAAFSTIMNEHASALGRPGDRAVIDLMLAHVPKDKVESAYNRAAFMDRRRELAQEWADLLLDGFWEPEALLGQPARPKAAVVQIRTPAGGAKVSIGRRVA